MPRTAYVLQREGRKKQTRRKRRTEEDEEEDEDEDPEEETKKQDEDEETSAYPLERKKRHSARLRLDILRTLVATDSTCHSVVDPQPSLVADIIYSFPCYLETKKKSYIVHHVPRELSSFFYLFILTHIFHHGRPRTAIRPLHSISVEAWS